MKVSIYVFVFIFCSLIFPPDQYAIGPCLKDCYKITNKCEPIIKDLQSPNRFKSCAGKPVTERFGYSKEDKTKEACQKAFYSTLDEVVKFEKENNFCNSSADCVAGSVGFPYHSNISGQPIEGYKLSKKVSDLRKACTQFDTPFNFLITAKDNIPPYTLRLPRENLRS